MEKRISVEGWPYWTLLVPAVVYMFRLLLTYRYLPQQSAIHFDLNGQANGWSSRATLGLVSIGSILMVLTLTLSLQKLVSNALPLAGVVFRGTLSFVLGLISGAFWQTISANLDSEKTFSAWPMIVWAFATLVLDLASRFFLAV